jgi:hypothetical protein
MNDPMDAGVTPDGAPPGRRRRTRQYGTRRTVSLRMDEDMHKRMMDLCDELKIPANTYTLQLIESDLRKRKR